MNKLENQINFVVYITESESSKPSLNGRISMSYSYYLESTMKSHLRTISEPNEGIWDKVYLPSLSESHG